MQSDLKIRNYLKYIQQFRKFVLLLALSYGTMKVFTYSRVYNTRIMLIICYYSSHLRFIAVKIRHCIKYYPFIFTIDTPTVSFEQFGSVLVC